MTPQLKFYTTVAFLLSSLFGAIGCVSVSIKAPQTTKARDFLFEKPAQPFEDLKTSSADHAWQNSKTGNTLAILTECNSQDPSLEFLQNENLNALSDLEIQATKKMTHQGHQALETDAEGTVDGIRLKVRLVTIKNNSCSYLLTYVGRHNSFSQDIFAFEKLRKGFQLQ